MPNLMRATIFWYEGRVHITCFFCILGYHIINPLSSKFFTSMAFKNIIIKIMRQETPVIFQVFSCYRSYLLDNWNMPYFVTFTMYNQSFWITKRDVTSSNGNKLTYSYSSCIHKSQHRVITMPTAV